MKRVEAVVKAVDMLAMIAANDGPLSVADAASSLELPRPTVYRLVTTLASLNLIDRQRDGLLPSGNFFELTMAQAGALSLADVVRPVLEGLTAEVGESAGLHVLTGGVRHCVVEIEGNHGIRWVRGPGFSAPAWNGAVGHVLLSCLLPRHLDELLEGFTPSGLASQSPADIDMVLTRVERARRQGWSYSYSETVEGAAALAVPVTLEGGHFAAVNLYAPADRRKALQAARRLLKEAADVIVDRWSHVAGPTVPSGADPARR